MPLFNKKQLFAALLQNYCVNLVIVSKLNYLQDFKCQFSSLEQRNITVGAVTPAVVCIVLMPLLEVHLPSAGHSFAHHVLHCTEMPLGGDNVTLFPAPPSFPLLTLI